MQSKSLKSITPKAKNIQNIFRFILPQPLILVAFIFTLSVTSIAKSDNKSINNKLQTKDLPKETIAKSSHKLISIKESQVEPLVLNMKIEDSIVFFLNETKESLTTLEIDYGKKTTHCASGNLKVQENGVVRSTKPFGVKDFASVCFHEKGTYPFKVFGLNNSADGIAGKIVVN